MRPLYLIFLLPLLFANTLYISDEFGQLKPHDWDYRITRSDQSTGRITGLAVFSNPTCAPVPFTFTGFDTTTDDIHNYVLSRKHCFEIPSPNLKTLSQPNKILEVKVNSPQAAILTPDGKKLIVSSKSSTTIYSLKGEPLYTPSASGTGLSSNYDGSLITIYSEDSLKAYNLSRLGSVKSGGIFSGKSIDVYGAVLDGNSLYIDFKSLNTHFVMDDNTNCYLSGPRIFCNHLGGLIVYSADRPSNFYKIDDFVYSSSSCIADDVQAYLTSSGDNYLKVYKRGKEKFSLPLDTYGDVHLTPDCKYVAVYIEEASKAKICDLDGHCEDALVPFNDDINSGRIFSTSTGVYYLALTDNSVQVWALTSSDSNSILDSFSDHNSSENNKTSNGHSEKKGFFSSIIAFILNLLRKLFSK